MASIMHNYVSFIYQTMTHKQLKHVIQLPSNNMQTISHGQSCSNKLSELFLTVLNQSVGFLWAAPSSSIGSTLVGPKIHGHFRPHNTQNHFHGLLKKEYPSRRRPLPLEVVETPQYRHPCIALAAGINFASCLAGLRRTDHREI